MIWRNGCARNECMAVTRRRGFTLMEMLIASVLTATLMAMIWSMLSMYSSYLTAGRQQAADRQLRRSIVQLLRQDLQRVAVPGNGLQVRFTLDDLTAEQSAIDEAELEVWELLVESAANAEDAELLQQYLGLPGGDAAPFRSSLLGTTESLRLCPETPAAEVLELARAQSAAGLLTPGDESGLSAASQLTGLPTGGAVGLTDEASGGPMTGGITAMTPSARRVVLWIFQPWGQLQSDQSRLPAGLCRIEFDQSLLQSIVARQNGNGGADVPDLETLVQEMFPLPSLAGEAVESTESFRVIPTSMRPQVELIPEVVSLQFQYFDGRQWIENWNSVGRRELPIAVRARMYLCRSSDLDQLRSFFGGSAGMEAGMETASDQNPEGSVTGSDGLEVVFPELQWKEVIIPLQAIRGDSPLLLEGEDLGMVNFGGGILR